MGSLAGMIFFVGLLIAIFSGHFLPIFFVTLGLSSFAGSLSSDNPHAGMGGFQGLVFFIGLAVCAAADVWWPGILVTLIICGLLGSLHAPLAGLLGRRMSSSYQQSQQPYYQPSQPPQPPQQPVQPYQEGYQAASRPETYQEGGQQHQYPPSSLPSYEMPQAQYPTQEQPPQQQ
jgi:hypothetical protein